MLCVWLWLLLTAGVFADSNRTWTAEAEAQLIEDLFLTNETAMKAARIVRPPGALLTGGTTYVSLSYYTLTIRGVDEKTGFITLSFWESLTWSDPRLVWEGDDRYEGVISIKVPHSYVWNPDTSFIYRGGEGESYHPESDPEFGTKLMIWNSGFVAKIFVRSINFHCNFDLTNFPNDNQTCSLRISSWVHHQDEVHFQLDSDLSSNIFEDRHADWTLNFSRLSSETTVYDCCKDPYQTLILTIGLQRKPTFYYYVFVVPASVITFFLPFIHFLPSGASEKTTFAGLLLVGSLLLHISLSIQIGNFAEDKRPLLMYHYEIQMIMIIVSVAISSITASIANVRHTTRRLPLLVRKALEFGVGRLCFGPANITGNLSHLTPTESSDHVRFNPTSDTLPIVGKSSQEISLPENSQDSSDKTLHSLIDELRFVRERRQLEREYYLLAALIDRLMAVAYILYAIIFLAYDWKGSQ